MTVSPNRALGLPSTGAPPDSAQFLPAAVDATAGAERPDGPPPIAGEGRLGRRLYFYGSGTALYGIQMVNVLLTLLTLGVYYFWGKVRVLGYVLSQTELEGDRFAYHGTGTELFLGFLKAALLFAVPFGLLKVNVVDPSFGLRIEAAMVGYGLIYFVLVPLALVGARRYRLSRISWRGIRFSFRGQAGDFIKLFARDSVLTLLTLGLYYPWFAVRRHAFMVSNSYFGNERFRFDGHGRELLVPYSLLALLGVPTLGLYSFWFQARKQRYLWQHTAIATVRFDSTVTGGALLRLRLGNALLLIGTLGFGWPWVRVRNLRFTFRTLRLRGLLEPSAIRQESRGAAASGEGLAGLVGTGIELGW